MQQELSSVQQSLTEEYATKRHDVNVSFELSIGIHCDLHSMRDHTRPQGPADYFDFVM